MALRDQPQNLWTDPVVAHQMETYATNATRADLARQENVYRMAELNLRRQQAEQTNQLNRLLTENQLRQQDLNNKFRDRQLAQDLEIARMPSVREAEFNKKLQLDEEDRRRAEEDELRIVTETEAALKELDRKDKMLTELEKIKGSGSKNINLPVIEANIARVGTTKSQISQQRQAIIDGMARSGYQYDPTTGKFIGVRRPGAMTSPRNAPLAANALNGNLPPIVDQARIDAIKREAAAAIQAGANPAAVYEEMARMGVDIR